MRNIAQRWDHVKQILLPFMEKCLGPMTEKEQRLVTILEIAQLDNFFGPDFRGPGRKKKNRTAIGCAFVAKMVFNLATTRDLIERLQSSPRLRRICGWSRVSEIPSESTFSRAFDEFAESELPAKVHQAMINKNLDGRLVGHISRDSSDVIAREKPVRKEQKAAAKKPKRKRGRPKKGEQRPKEKTRLERQPGMELEQMIDDLPTACDIGTKKKMGKTYHWKGYKLHADFADGEIPISCVLSSASLHDSQVAIPLATISNERVLSLYDLMDSAYDAKAIHEHSLKLGHVPIIDSNPRKGEKVEMAPARKLRYNERSTAERGFSNLKDNYGGRNLRVRGHNKVYAHLMFGIVALTAERLLGLLL